MDAFGAYARYYDLLYRDKDYGEEAGYVHGLIQRYAPGAQTILDLGCGTGAHAAEFAQLGYHVHGVDASEGMLELARIRQEGLAPYIAARLQFSRGDVREFRARRRFDVVTALFHVVSYQVTDEDLARTFAVAADNLVQGGIFLFDFWYGPAVLCDPPAVRVKRLEDAATRVQRIAEPAMREKENVVEVNYEVQVTDLASGRMEEIHERHRLRCLFEPELMNCLQAARLERVHFSEWMSDESASAETWYAVMVGRATMAGGN